MFGDTDKNQDKSILVNMLKVFEKPCTPFHRVPTEKNNHN